MRHVKLPVPYETPQEILDARNDVRELACSLETKIELAPQEVEHFFRWLIAFGRAELARRHEELVTAASPFDGLWSEVKCSND